MTIADETLYRITRDNDINPDFDKSFLLEEIKYRERQITKLVEKLNQQMVSLPAWVEEIADEYGIELE